MPNSTFTPINIRRACYAMVNESGNVAEITMYGDIVESQPTDWWTGEPIPGSYIIQDEFLKDLNTVVTSGCEKLVLRMNSYGGDAGVSIVIHNRIRELAQSGIETSCIVDGVAMSGGSLIMCACDNVKVNPSSLVMIHKAWCRLFGGYNADELRNLADQNDAWDKAQISIYTRKCKLSETVISHMMSETTYMTGKEAVDKGFADELLEDAEPLEIAASADRKALFVRGQKYHLARGMAAPESIPITTSSQEGVKNKTSADTDSEGGNKPMAKNLEELRTENPELAAQVESEVRAAVSAEHANSETNATNAERQRLAEIDSIAHLYDDETVRNAKYGENPCTAQEMAFRAAQAAAKTGGAFMAGVKSDYDASGASGVGAAPADNGNGGAEPTTPEAKQAEARANVKALLGKN